MPPADVCWPGVPRAGVVRPQVGTDAKRIAEVIRGHWGIENRLHVVLDVAFAEDPSRIHNGHSADSLSRKSRMALDLPHRESGKKRGIQGTRLKAAWDHVSLLNILTGKKAVALVATPSEGR